MGSTIFFTFKSFSIHKFSRMFSRINAWRVATALTFLAMTSQAVLIEKGGVFITYGDNQTTSRIIWKFEKYRNSKSEFSYELTFEGKYTFTEVTFSPGDVTFEEIRELNHARLTIEVDGVDSVDYKINFSSDYELKKLQAAMNNAIVFQNRNLHYQLN